MTSIENVFGLTVWYLIRLLIACISATNGLISLFIQWMNELMLGLLLFLHCPVSPSPVYSANALNLTGKSRGQKRSEENHRCSWQPHRCQEVTAAWRSCQRLGGAFQSRWRGCGLPSLPHVPCDSRPWAMGRPRQLRADGVGVLQQRARAEATWVIWWVHIEDHPLEGAASNSLVSLQKRCLIFCSCELSGGLNLRAAVYPLGWWCSAPGCWLRLWVLGELSTHSDTYHPWGLTPSSFWGVSASVAPSLFAHLGLFHLD